MLHGWELVEHFLFADTEATVRIGLSLDVLKLDGDVQAARVEVRSRLVVVVALIHLSHPLVSLETVTSLLFAPVKFSLFQSVANVGQLLRCLLKRLLDMLVQFLLLKKLLAWLNLGRCRLVRQIEEVDVGLHEALAEQLDSDALLVLVLVQLEATALSDGILIHNTRSGGFLGLLALRSILLKHLSLGGGDQLVLLLGLRFLHDLADASVWIEDWLVFHLQILLVNAWFSFDASGLSCSNISLFVESLVCVPAPPLGSQRF